MENLESNGKPSYYLLFITLYPLNCSLYCLFPTIKSVGDDMGMSVPYQENVNHVGDTGMVRYFMIHGQGQRGGGKVVSGG
jgi:hypothetical protein